MRTVKERAMLLAGAAALLGMLNAGPAAASSIPMPAGSRSWILVSGADCDDDGPNVNVDRGHCIAAVSHLDVPGDIGHDLYQNYSIHAEARITAEQFHGSISAGNLFAFLDMAMIDTYTLHSKTIPAGTVVPITVTFRGVADIHPAAFGSTWGGGTFGIRINNYFNPDPIVIPENTRIGGQLGPAAAAQFFQFPSPGPAVIPLDLTAQHTMDVTVGVSFDLSFYLAARPIAATIAFSNTATIGFSLPDGTWITSVGGYGQSVAVEPTTWGGLKARFD